MRCRLDDHGLAGIDVLHQLGAQRVDVGVDIAWRLERRGARAAR